MAKRTQITTTAFLLLLALAACSGQPNSSDNGETPKTPIDGIQFDSGVTQKQHDTLGTTLSILQTLPITQPSDELLETLGIPSADPATLLSWLQERVHYIVPSDFDMNSRIVVQDGHYAYPNPGVLPVIEVSPSPSATANSPTTGALVADTSSAQVIMLNISGFIYIQGKAAGQLYAAKLDGVGSVPITSPRSGILEIGDGMFTDQEAQEGSEEEAIFQLGVLFHEARHSDGNKTSTAFIHAICPDYSDYAGLYACDRALNGAYTVGALVTRDLVNNCADCSEETVERLDMVYLDYSNRVLYDAATVETDSGPVKLGPASIWDDQPEGTFTAPAPSQ